MKPRVLHLLLLTLPVLPACHFPDKQVPAGHVDETGNPPTHPPKLKTPRKPEPPSRPPVKEDPLARVYRYNPTQRPNKPFLTSANALGGNHTYDSGYPLTTDDRVAIRASLVGKTIDPVAKNFRPDVAIVIFDKNKTPLQCIEVCRGNNRAQVYEARTGTRRELADASQAADVIQKHLPKLLARP